MTFQTIEDLMEALYQWLSGFRGPRDSASFKALFLDGARIVMVKDGQLRSGTPDDFLREALPRFASKDFFERQVQLSLNVVGQTAAAVSHYETSSSPFQHAPNPTAATGTNHLTLVNDGSRWWIVSLVWQAGNSRPKV